MPFTLAGASVHDPEVEAWLNRPGELFVLAKHWFACMKACAADVTEVMHDGAPTACIGDAAFAYVNVFTAHMNVGFFKGASLSDPSRLLEGTGKRMRHVKLRAGGTVDEDALVKLIQGAYSAVKQEI